MHAHCQRQACTIHGAIGEAYLLRDDKLRTGFATAAKVSLSDEARTRESFRRAFVQWVEDDRSLDGGVRKWLERELA